MARMTNHGHAPSRSARHIVFMIGVAAVIVATSFGARGLPKGSPPRIALAVVQSLATAVSIVVPLLGIRRLDELQQRIHLVALAIAFAGTGIVIMTFAWLEEAGLPRVDWGIVTWPMMVGLWVAGFLFASRRYS